MTFELYIEGGGDNRRLGAQFREGWTSFLRIAGLSGHMPKVIRGGSRRQTFDRYAKEVENPRPRIVPLLLVDSEDAVDTAHSVWQHLRAHDGWHKPAHAGENDAFLMAQVMETWFLADRDALRDYFGPLFMENALKAWAELEHVPKATVVEALEKASARCPKPYTKGKISFELLAKTDPARVETACPHAEEFLIRLRTTRTGAAS